MSTLPETDRPDENRVLVAEYVLGLLSSAEHERVGRLIEDSQRLRTERDFWINHFSALNEQFESVPAPAHLLREIEAKLFAAQNRPVGFWDNILLWRGLAAGALAVAVLAVGLNVFRPVPEQPATASQFVAMLEEAGSDLRLVAYYDGGNELRLTTLGGGPVADRDYELWVIEGDNAPVSMGLLATNAVNTVQVASADVANWADGALLAVTLEPLGGAPDGVPTGPIVAKGTLAEI